MSTALITTAPAPPTPPLVVLSPTRSKRSHDYMQTSPHSPCSPTTRGKRSKYEYDLTNLGYHSDPSKPNLFILSPGPGLLELHKDHHAPFKRHQSKVRAILPPRSQSLFTSPPLSQLHHHQINTPHHPALPPQWSSHHLPLTPSTSTAGPLFSQHQQPAIDYLSSSSSSSSLDSCYSIASGQREQLQTQHETDNEILSSLASIATSFEDEMDEIEAVFLHFSEEF